MKTLEIRRHSHRKHTGGSQLSQEGVAYARTLGANMGPFNLVATTVSPRSRETAIAMGFAVDQEFVVLTQEESVYAEMEASQWWKDDRSIASLARLMEKRGPTWLLGSSLAAAMRDLLTPLPDGASVLVISHSGDIEVALTACLPNADHTQWGDGFGPCEGARLTFGGEPARFLGIEFLRGEQP